MDFLDKNIVEYSKQHSSNSYVDGHAALLVELERETWANMVMPRMISGHIQGRILSMISKITQPKNILEIGTYTGFSALCLAEGLMENGQLDTLEFKPELQDIIQKYFNKSTFKNKLNLHIGNALELIPTLNKTYDLVFIDADKDNYLNYYKLCIDKMNVGGIIIADNVLWSGKVLEESERNTDKDTKALYEFSKYIQADERVENLLMPIRDGLMIIRKC